MTDIDVEVFVDILGAGVILVVTDISGSGVGVSRDYSVEVEIVEMELKDSSVVSGIRQTRRGIKLCSSGMELVSEASSTSTSSTGGTELDVEDCTLVYVAS